eukprot:jgi/Chrzof1/8991/Cz03g32040.t1
MGTLVVPPSESRAPPSHLAYPLWAAVGVGFTYVGLPVGLRGSIPNGQSFRVAKAGTFSWCNLFSRQALGCCNPAAQCLLKRIPANR